MVDWPASLPQHFFSGLGDRRGPTRLRSEVDVGPAIVRRRYTAAVRKVRVPIVLSFAERDIFDAFYIDDLKEGTLSFNWADPVTGATTTMRFDGDAGPAWSGNGPWWSAMLDLEILP